MQGPPPTPPIIFKTPPFAHYGLAWSPFYGQRIALASAANYGLVGNGRLHIVSVQPGGVVLDKQYDTQDGLYDVAWSETNENQIVTASGDGSIKLWDMKINDLPIRAWFEHSREVFSIDWSNVEKHLFASSSWDGSVKLWTPERPQSLTTLPAHHGCVYQVLFSPHVPSVLASCSTDGTLKIFDVRQPRPTTSTHQPLATPALTVPAHGTEVLSFDWNKYRPWVVATASVDRTLKVFDVRMVKGANDSALAVNAVGGVCEVELQGHEYAVRKVQWSPHRADLIASASYDMSCRMDDDAPAARHTLVALDTRPTYR
ncbi:peroxisomal targeting signal 2 receptor, partial [Tulasnella sp. 403]